MGMGRGFPSTLGVGPGSLAPPIPDILDTVSVITQRLLLLYGELDI